MGETCPNCKKKTEFGEHSFNGFARTETGAITGSQIECAKCGHEWVEKHTGIAITPGLVLLYVYLMFLSIVISIIIYHTG